MLNRSNDFIYFIQTLNVEENCNVFAIFQKSNHLILSKPPPFNQKLFNLLMELRIIKK